MHCIASPSDVLSKVKKSSALAGNADLRKADLRGANFEGANLRDADLRGARIDASIGWLDADTQGCRGCPAHGMR